MMIRYWYHPESDSLFTTENEEIESDGLLVELDKDEYEEVEEKLKTG